VLTAMVAMAALASSAWRSSTVILLTMLAIGVLMLAASGAGAMFLQSHNLASASTAVHLRNVGFESSLLILAIVCSWLHHWRDKPAASAF
jgi:hypothetical protein